MCSHKRSRSESKTDDLISLKKKKIDLNELRDGEIFHEDNNHSLCRSYTPKKENFMKFEFNNSSLIFKALISPNDENSLEILASKLKLMKETIEMIENLLENQKITKIGPISYDTKMTQTDFSENLDSASDLEIIEISPSLEAKHTNNENIFLKKNKEITQDSLKEIENIWNDKRHEEILWKIQDSTLLYKDIKCLQHGEFINDEIVNAYLKLFPLPKNTYVFNSFFYEYIAEMLSTDNWNIKKITRILKKQGINSIFSKKYLIFPINLNKSHWAAAQINNREKCIEYYDSFGENNFERVCDTINEFISKFGGEEINFYEYRAMKVPLQSSGCDCGIFMLQAIRCLIENREFGFEQEKIDFIRKIIALELKNQTLYNLL